MTEHAEKPIGESSELANPPGNLDTCIQALITDWIVPVLVKRFLSTVEPTGNLGVVPTNPSDRRSGTDA